MYKVQFGPHRPFFHFNPIKDEVSQTKATLKLFSGAAEQDGLNSFDKGC